MQAHADHPFIAAILERFGSMQPDGTFAATAVDELDAVLQPLTHEPLADALWNALVFAQFFEAKYDAKGVAAQLLTLVEKHAARLPRDLQTRLEIPSADITGTTRSLQPVGAVPAPAGSVRGGLSARFAAIPRQRP